VGLAVGTGIPFAILMLYTPIELGVYPEVYFPAWISKLMALVILGFGLRLLSIEVGDQKAHRSRWENLTATQRNRRRGIATPPPKRRRVSAKK
jgi:hypothetical protein